MKITYLAIAFLFLINPVRSFSAAIQDTLELAIPDVAAPQDPNAKIKVLKDAISQLNHEADLEEEGDLRIEMSKIMFKEGWSKKAFSQLLTAEMLYHKAGNSAKREAVIGQMAAFYKANNALADAEKYYTLLLQVQESQQKYAEAVKTANILGSLLLKRHNVKQASKYLNSVVENKYDLPNDKSSLADAYVRLAEIRKGQKKYKQAEYFILKKALGLYRSSDNLLGRVDCFDILGKIYLEQKRYSEAKWFFIQANTQARALDDQKAVVTSLVNLSKVKLAIHDNALALRDLKEASLISGQMNNLSLIADVKEGYALYYASTGNKAAANRSRERSVTLDDSVKFMMASQIESAQTAQVVKNEPKPVEIVNEPATPQKRDYYLQIGIAAFFTLILLFYFSRRNRRNRLLEE